MAAERRERRGEERRAADTRHGQVLGDGGSAGGPWERKGMWFVLPSSYCSSSSSSSPSSSTKPPLSLSLSLPLMTYFHLPSCLPVCRPTSQPPFPLIHSPSFLCMLRFAVPSSALCPMLPPMLFLPYQRRLFLSGMRRTGGEGRRRRKRKRKVREGFQNGDGR